MLKKKAKNVVWKPIKGYEDKYEINEYGAVRSLDRWSTHKRPRKLQGKPLSTLSNKMTGYQSIGLCKEGVIHTYGIARLVAQAFLDFDISDDSKVVTFHDTDPYHTHYKNLLITTREEVRKRTDNRKAQTRLSRRIQCINKKGKRYTFSSIRAAAIKFGVSHVSILYWLSTGRYYRGWKFSDAPEKREVPA